MSNKPTPNPSDAFAAKDADPNTLAPAEEGAESNTTPTKDLQKLSAGSGTIKVNG